MPPRRLLVEAVVCCLTFSTVAIAQRVHGTVRDSVSALPVPGVVLTLLDSAGGIAARTISDERGQYAMPLSRAVARMRAVRIGFQPRDRALARRAIDQDVALDFAMARIPALLERIDVRDRALCPGSSDRGSAFALWEQVKAGLEATVVAREARPADVTTLMYDRTLSPSDDRVQSMTIRANIGRATRPFLASAPPATFAKRGYLEENNPGRTYHAPDADVLLDESFATTHCFRIVAPDEKHRDQVGLEFKPALVMDTIVDVAGVLWVDRQQPALRSLEFRYVGLEPIAATVRSGGALNFRTMANGIVVIDWWVIRVPEMVTKPREPVMGITPTASERRATRNDLRVVAVHESGGELLLAKWADGAEWKHEPGRIRGRVTERGSQTPRGDVVVQLEGARIETTTDRDGSYSLAPVVPGRYTLSAADTLLSDLTDARSASRTIDVTRGDTITADFTVRPLAEVIPRACQGVKMGVERSILLGTLFDSTGRVMRNATVSARWFDEGEMVGRVLQAQHTERTYQVDEQGRFRICGVVRERPIALSVTQGSPTVLGDTSVFAYDLVKRFVWRVAPRSRQRASAEPTAVLGGQIVLASSGVPVSGVEVSVTPGDRHTSTDSLGRFELRNLPPGPVRILVRDLRFIAVTDSITLENGVRLDRVYRLTPQKAVQLDTVRTLAPERRFISPASGIRGAPDVQLLWSRER
jgi:carboxypeptidase family protein